MLGFLAAALAALFLAATPLDADAAVTRKKAMWGPAEVNGISQFPVYADLGVGLWQTSVKWSDIAPRRPANPRNPSDPAYRWPASLDRAIAAAARHGIQVTLTVMGAPPWANGGRHWSWAPLRARDWGDFVEAAGRRYPQIRHWMIWGEPTKSSNFQPLAPDNGRPVRGENLRGPRIYARLVDTAYVRLKRLSRRNLVIGGNTFTVGSVAPLRWIKAVKMPNGRPPRMDLWGHNPFSLRKPDLSDGPLGRGYADFNDLDTLARHLDRAMRRATLRKQRRLRIYVSEYALPTDQPNYAFNFWVDRATQADWVGRALRISRGYKRIYTFGYFSLYDEPRRPAGDEPLWGLLQRDGRAKPAYQAFRAG